MSSTPNTPPAPEQPNKDPNRFRLTPEQLRLAAEGARQDIETEKKFLSEEFGTMRLCHAEPGDLELFDFNGKPAYRLRDGRVYVMALDDQGENSWVPSTDADFGAQAVPIDDETFRKLAGWMVEKLRVRDLTPQTPRKNKRAVKKTKRPT